MNTHAVLLIAVSALVTALIRFAPFLVFRGGRETPAVILRLGKLLPCAVMSMLVVYCLRNMNFAGASHALPEIIAAARFPAANCRRIKKAHPKVRQKPRRTSKRLAEFAPAGANGV